MQNRTVAILFHDTTTPAEARDYRIWHCAQVWRRLGLDVKFAYGHAVPIQADLLIPQVDLSVLPGAYRRTVNSHHSVVNRNVADTLKTSFSRNLVSLNDDYDGPVIVKTNANFGGQPESRALQRLPRHRRFLFRWRMLSLAR